MPPPIALAGLSVAVTGGGNGIGRAIAESFARAGAKVAIGDVDGDAAEAVAASLGPDAFGVQLDVTDRDAFARFLDSAEELNGPLDVMVNNAGIDWIGPSTKSRTTSAAGRSTSTFSARSPDRALRCSACCRAAAVTW